MHANIPTLLRATAGELSELAGIADQLAATGISDVERWQSVDRMSQHLAGMASFVLVLSSMVPDMLVDIALPLSSVTTSALADRLAGRPCRDDADSGALELFEA